jgi:hypothetical protein
MRAHTSHKAKKPKAKLQATHNGEGACTAWGSEGRHAPVRRSFFAFGGELDAEPLEELSECGIPAKCARTGGEMNHHRQLS